MTRRRNPIGMLPARMSCGCQMVQYAADPDGTPDTCYRHGPVAIERRSAGSHAAVAPADQLAMFKGDTLERGGAYTPGQSEPDPVRHKLVPTRGRKQSRFVYGRDTALAEAQRQFSDAGVPVMVVQYPESLTGIRTVATIGGKTRARR